MKVQFLGAAQTVTGSCYMIEACGKRFCVDCGMHQGNKAIEARNRDSEPYRAANVDFVLLTHAHIDHSGLIPLLVKEGFKGEIYCTPATGELIGIMLEDSAHIQEMEALFEQRKYARRGLKNLPTTVDALPCLIEPRSIELFARHGVFTEAELHARYEIQLENYAKIVAIEAETALSSTSFLGISTTSIPCSCSTEVRIRLNCVIVGFKGSSPM